MAWDEPLVMIWDWPQALAWGWLNMMYQNQFLLKKNTGLDYSKITLVTKDNQMLFFFIFKFIEYTLSNHFLFQLYFGNLYPI